jgi:hypothetical protein
MPYTLFTALKAFGLKDDSFLTVLIILQFAFLYKNKESQESNVRPVKTKCHVSVILEYGASSLEIRCFDFSRQRGGIVFKKLKYVQEECFRHFLHDTFTLSEIYGNKKPSEADSYFKTTDILSIPMQIPKISCNKVCPRRRIRD